MEVLALPGSLTDCKSKLLEATLQRVPFAALAPRRRVKLYNFHQIFSNQARQCGVSFNGNLANPFHKIIRQRKRKIHDPIKGKNIFRRDRQFKHKTQMYTHTRRKTNKRK